VDAAQVESVRLNLAVTLAIMVRGADTAQPELSPEAPGLLAASLGLSRMYADDLEQLDADASLRRPLSLVPRCHRRNA
jgi:hypothetical protein